jgi:p-methyltransferase
LIGQGRGLERGRPALAGAERKMTVSSPIDCIIVGYNEVNFATFANQTKTVHTGAHHEMRTNSLLFQGKRMLYMDLLNHLFTGVTGRNPQLNVFETPSLGVCYLQNYLQQRGHQSEVVNFFTHEKEKFKRLLAQSPRAVAITTTFYIDNAPITEIVNFVRQHNPTTKIIVGGPHIYNIFSDYDQTTQAYIFKNIGADIYITDSQGEQTLSCLLDQIKGAATLDNVPNLVYYSSDRKQLHRTARAVEDNDMSQNSIRWENFDPAAITPLTYLRTARSCPFSCLFCNYPTLAGSHDLSNLDVIERELDTLHNAGTKVLVFIDDTFNVPLPRFKKLLKLMIDKQYGFQWFSFLRCSNVDEAAIDLMKASGCTGVLLGIESGDQTMLNNMNKNAKRETYMWGIEQLHQRGIATYTSLICGYPGETAETVQNTIEFMQAVAPTFYNVQLYYHDLRTPIHRQAEAYGIQGGGYNWRHKTMNWQEAAEWAIYMYQNIHTSIPIPLIGFSLWGIAYLVAKGISIEQLKSFGRVAKEIYIPSLRDIAIDCTQQERALHELFKDISLHTNSYQER